MPHSFPLTLNDPPTPEPKTLTLSELVEGDIYTTPVYPNSQFVVLTRFVRLSGLTVVVARLHVSPNNTISTLSVEVLSNPDFPVTLVPKRVANITVTLEPK